MKYARRQGSLADNGLLRYKGLNDFDRAMQSLDVNYNLLHDPLIEQLMIHEHRKLLIYRRGPLVFAFNFHPTESYPDLRIPVPDPTDYKLIVDSDDPAFEGFGRIAKGVKYVWDKRPWEGREQSIRVYLPNRTALVLAPA
jgi:1,4-alpha-glucan branching enzyme